MAVLKAVNAVSTGLFVQPRETVTVTIDNTGYVGRAVLERERKGGWDEVQAWTGAAAAVTHRHEGKATRVRLRASAYTSRQAITFSAEADAGTLKLTYDESDPIEIDFDAATPAADLQAALRLIAGLEAVTVTGDFATGFVVTFTGLDAAELLVDATSDLEASSNPVTVTIAERTITYTLALSVAEALLGPSPEGDEGTVPVQVGDGLALAGGVLSAGLDIQRADAVTTSDAAATPVSLETYQTNVTTGGSEGDEDLEIGDGTGAILGQRKAITLVTHTHASDVVVLDHANIINAAGNALDAATLDAAGDAVLLEWNGAKWQIVHAVGGTFTEAA